MSRNSPVRNPRGEQRGRPCPWTHSADRIFAHYDHGVLTLHIPVAENAKPRMGEIQNGGAPAVEVVSSVA